MPYKLDLFDVNIRKKMVEAIKGNKVHRKKDSIIDTKVKQSFERENKEQQKSNDKNKKYITVNGVKYKGERIEVDANKSQSSLNEDSIGIFIDKVK